MKANLHRTLRRIRKLQHLIKDVKYSNRWMAREMSIRMMALSADLTLLRWCNEEKLAIDELVKTIATSKEKEVNHNIFTLIEKVWIHKNRLRYATKLLQRQRAVRRMDQVELEFDWRLKK